MPRIFKRDGLPWLSESRAAELGGGHATPPSSSRKNSKYRRQRVEELRRDRARSARRACSPGSSDGLWRLNVNMRTPRASSARVRRRRSPAASSPRARACRRSTARSARRGRRAGAAGAAARVRAAGGAVRRRPRAARRRRRVVGIPSMRRCAPNQYGSARRSPTSRARRPRCRSKGGAGERSTSKPSSSRSAARVRAEAVAARPCRSAAATPRLVLDRAS